MRQAHFTEPFRPVTLKRVQLIWTNWQTFQMMGCITNATCNFTCMLLYTFTTYRTPIHSQMTNGYITVNIWLSVSVLYILDFLLDIYVLLSEVHLKQNTKLNRKTQVRWQVERQWYWRILDTISMIATCHCQFSAQILKNKDDVLSHQWLIKWNIQLK